MVKTLKLGPPDLTYSHISFDDERDRVEAEELSDCVVASITLHSNRPECEQSWGEFLSLADIALLHSWTGAMLADAHRT